MQDVALPSAEDLGSDALRTVQGDNSPARIGPESKSFSVARDCHQTWINATQQGSVYHSHLADRRLPLSDARQLTVVRTKHFLHVFAAFDDAIAGSELEASEASIEVFRMCRAAVVCVLERNNARRGNQAQSRRNKSLDLHIDCLKR